MPKFLVLLTALASAGFLAMPSGSARGQVAGAQTTPVSGQIIAGWVENGWIGSPPIKVKVKLDTGARNSSISAPQYREFEKNGRPYVSFTLINNEGREVDIERPVKRMATVRSAGAGKSARPVVMLKICVAGVTSEVEFTMADRTKMRYPILIGRSFLAEKLLVDSARTFLASGLCQKN